LLGKRSPAVDDVVEQRARVGSQAGEGHQVVRGANDVDEVKLEQAESMDTPGKVGTANFPRARLTKSLRSQCDTSRVARSQRIRGVHARDPVPPVDGPRSGAIVTWRYWTAALVNPQPAAAALANSASMHTVRT
jgi:hypothetical protein